MFYSAYMPVVSDRNLPARNTPPPLLREHRLYQADWLLRFYGFTAAEILDEEAPDFDPLLDPKCCWAVRHMELFPLEVNSAPYEMLLRVPGIGVKSARRIRAARRYAKLDFPDLKKLGVVLKRARFFLICRGKSLSPCPRTTRRSLRGHPGGVPLSPHPAAGESGRRAGPGPAGAALPLRPHQGGWCKMPYRTNLIYHYDGSYQGFLCCVASVSRPRSCPWTSAPKRTSSRASSAAGTSPPGWTWPSGWSGPFPGGSPPRPTAWCGRGFSPACPSGRWPCCAFC